MKTFQMPSRQLQRGLSLVELMVALAIGAFLLAGAITVFGKTRDLYRNNDGAARLQKRRAMRLSTIEADLRMANYWGQMSRADFIENGPALDPANPPDVDPAYTLPAELAPYAVCRQSMRSDVGREAARLRRSQQ